MAGRLEYRGQQEGTRVGARYWPEKTQDIRAIADCDLPPHGQRVKVRNGTCITGQWTCQDTAVEAEDFPRAEEDFGQAGMGIK
ncbi:hypothetical protein PG985_008049 [Apiospora marii]|uniref:uncharacterized protein n=1 Tax=Apiospora marii TaxID=335849 RepID=UPI00312D762C